MSSARLRINGDGEFEKEWNKLFGFKRTRELSAVELGECEALLASAAA